MTAATTMEVRRLILVKLESGAATGWGEAAPVPGHTLETLEDAWDALEAASVEILANPAKQSVDEHPGGFAAAALGQAAADVTARLAGTSLGDLLGATEPVWASAAIGLDADGSPDREALATITDAGYRNAKLKISPGTNPADLAALIADYGSLTFGLDANGSLAAAGSDYFARIDALDVAYLEQPGSVDDLAWHRELRASRSTPMALDESAADPAAIDKILATGAADIVNIKPGRFGTEHSLALARKAADYGVAARVGGLVESGIGRAHAVALAGCPEFSVVGDIAASSLYFVNDLVWPQWEIRDGRLIPPAAPGIGVEVDEGLIARSAFWSFVAE